MNSLIAITFCCVVAMACADEYGYGFRRTPNGIEAVYNNAARQLRVNDIAEHVGASSGTAYRYGVPGTGNYFSNDRYGSDDDYYGHNGYGQGY